MGHMACTEPQCLYRGALYLYFLPSFIHLYCSPIVTEGLTHLCKLVRLEKNVFPHLLFVLLLVACRTFAARQV
jgi:hypothetical protein